MSAQAINIGINESERLDIATGLSRLLADSYTLYLKTHYYLHISEHSDHPFRDYTIADFAIIRSPIPRFSGHF